MESGSGFIFSNSQFTKFEFMNQMLNITKEFYTLNSLSQEILYFFNNIVSIKVSCKLSDRENLNWPWGYSNVFPSKKLKKNFVSWLQFIRHETLHYRCHFMKIKWIEIIKYWKSWWYPFCTPLKFDKSHLIFL